MWYRTDKFTVCFWTQSVKCLERAAQRAYCSRHEVLGRRNYGRRISSSCSKTAAEKKPRIFSSGCSGSWRARRSDDVAGWLTHASNIPTVQEGATACVCAGGRTDGWSVGAPRETTSTPRRLPPTTSGVLLRSSGVVLICGRTALNLWASDATRNLATRQDAKRILRLWSFSSRHGASVGTRYGAPCQNYRRDLISIHRYDVAGVSLL